MPGVEAIGQTIDGVSFNGNVNNGVKSVAFSTDEDGNFFAGKGITAVHIRFNTIGGQTNINQGFLAFNGRYIKYFTGIKPTVDTIYVLEESISEQSIAPNSGNTMAIYNHYRMGVGSEIESISFYGHENASILGEGAQIEFWAYGYWDE